VADGEGARVPARAPLDVLADAWEAAWTGRRSASFTDCCTPDVQYEDPVVSEPALGVEALAAHAKRLWHAFPDIRVERTGQRLGTDRFGCFPWRVLGTHRGDLSALPSTGRFLTLHGMHYVEIADGRIRRARAFFDLYDVGVQLGLLPARGGLGETALLLLRGFGLRPRS
jgi:steroid delta-isomerase-like uncharacterized protein